jgi:uncharacterized membrane protein
MIALVVGLVLFLGIHSIRIVAEPLRSSLVSKLGEQGYKGVYTLISFAGLGLIIWGYGQTRISPVDLWFPPPIMRSLAIWLTLIAFILISASYVPGNRIKARLGHPMVAGVGLWALAHLISNGRLGDAVLFGAFLVWAILNFIAARRRDRLAGVAQPAITGVFANAVTAIAGIVVWAVFALFIHAWLIGVRPFV